VSSLGLGSWRGPQLGYIGWKLREFRRWSASGAIGLGGGRLCDLVSRAGRVENVEETGSGTPIYRLGGARWMGARGAGEGHAQGEPGRLYPGSVVSWIVRSVWIVETLVEHTANVAHAARGVQRCDTSCELRAARAIGEIELVRA
jgi:hypothetical protein